MSMLRRRMLPGLALTLIACAVVSVPVAAAAAVPPDRTAPTTPTGLHVQTISHTWLTLAWNPSTDNSGTVMYDVTVTTPSNPLQERAFTTSQSFGGLVAGQTYTASVHAVDLDGNTSPAVSVEFSTPARTLPPPTTPTNLRGRYVNGNLSSIAWDPSTHGTPVSYLLYSGDRLLASSTETSISIFDLVEVYCAVDLGSTHTLTVQAVSADNDLSARSAALTVTIPSTLPPR